MPSWSDSLLVFLGAGIGAVGRFWVSLALAQKSALHSFPWGTFAVNVAGSLLIGLLAGLLHRHSWPESWRIFLGVGVLGGFTTFSAFSLETLQLIEQGRGLSAALYVLGSLACGLAACWAAWWLSRGAI